MSELVSEAKFPASWENTGNFRNYVANTPSPKACQSVGCRRLGLKSADAILSFPRAAKRHGKAGAAMKLRLSGHRNTPTCGGITTVSWCEPRVGAE